MNSVKSHELKTFIPIPAYIEWVLQESFFQPCLIPTEISATLKVHEPSPSSSVHH